MEEKNIFKNAELRVVASIYLGKKITPKESTIARRLIRNPLKPLKLSQGVFSLTEMGKDLAEGFLGSLLELRRAKHAFSR